MFDKSQTVLLGTTRTVPQLWTHLTVNYTRARSALHCLALTRSVFLWEWYWNVSFSSTAKHSQPPPPNPVLPMLARVDETVAKPSPEVKSSNLGECVIQFHLFRPNPLSVSSLHLSLNSQREGGGRVAIWTILQKNSCLSFLPLWPRPFFRSRVVLSSRRTS